MSHHSRTEGGYDLAMIDMRNFVASLDKLLKENGWNTSELSRRSGVSRTQIDFVLSGDRQITILRASMIARAFGVYLKDMISSRPPAANAAEESRLLDNYRLSPQPGKDVIQSVAEKFADDDSSS